MFLDMKREKKISFFSTILFLIHNFIFYTYFFFSWKKIIYSPINVVVSSAITIIFSVFLMVSIFIFFRKEEKFFSKINTLLFAFNGFNIIVMSNLMLFNKKTLNEVLGINFLIVISYFILIIFLLLHVFFLFKELNGMSYYISKYFFKQAMNKIRIYKKITVTLFTTLLIVLGSFIYYDFFYRKEIDLFAYNEIKVQGLDGHAILYVENSNFPEELSDIRNSISYDLSKNESLSVNDVVTITIKIDDIILKKHKLKLAKTKIEFTVGKLEYIPSNFSDIPNLSILDSEMRKEVENSYFNKRELKAEVVQTCYSANLENEQTSYGYTKLNHGTIINIFKVTYKQASFFSVENMITEFVGHGKTNIIIDSDDNLKNDYEKWRTTTYDNFTDIREDIEGKNVICPQI